MTRTQDVSVKSMTIYSFALCKKFCQVQAKESNVYEPVWCICLSTTVLLPLLSVMVEMYSYSGKNSR